MKNGHVKKCLSKLLAVLFLFSLLLYPSQSFQGAATGLQLWGSVVVPTLLPFMLCSDLLTVTGGYQLLMKPLQFFFRTIFHLSVSGSYTLIMGILCGYPMGAKVCAGLLSERKLEQTEAFKLMAYISYPSPMFLLGYVLPRLQSSLSTWQMMTAVYLPVLPLAMMSNSFYSRMSYQSTSSAMQATCLYGNISQHNTSWNNTAPHHNNTSQPPQPQSSLEADQHLSIQPLSLDDRMANSCSIMIKVGCYLMLFSILSHNISLIPHMGDIPAALISAVCEMTTGIQALSACLTTASSTGKCLLSTAIIMSAAFGGLSGLFQTWSVIKNAGLSIQHYLMWKILHCSLSGLIVLALHLLEFL